MGLHTKKDKNNSLQWFFSDKEKVDAGNQWLIFPFKQFIAEEFQIETLFEEIPLTGKEEYKFENQTSQHKRISMETVDSLNPDGQN